MKAKCRCESPMAWIRGTEMTELFPKGYKAVPDEKKTDADWELDERLGEFAQDAFNKHWLECSKYLDAVRGGQQTSRDLHMLCQGFALARLAATPPGLHRETLERAAREAENYDTFDRDVIVSSTGARIAIGIAERLRTLAALPGGGG